MASSKYSPRLFGRTGEDAWGDMAFPPDITDPNALAQSNVHTGELMPVMNYGAYGTPTLPFGNTQTPLDEDTGQGFTTQQRLEQAQAEVNRARNAVVRFTPPHPFNDPYPIPTPLPAATPLPDTGHDINNLLKWYPIVSLLGGNRVANQILPGAVGGVEQHADEQYRMQEAARQAETQRILANNQYAANAWLQAQRANDDMNQANARFDTLQQQERNQGEQRALDNLRMVQDQRAKEIATIMRDMSISSKIMMSPQSSNPQVVAAAEDINRKRIILRDQYHVSDATSLIDPTDAESIIANRMSATDLEKFKQASATERTNILAQSGYLGRIGQAQIYADAAMERQKLAQQWKTEEAAKERVSRYNLARMLEGGRNTRAANALDVAKHRADLISNKLGNISAYRGFLSSYALLKEKQAQIAQQRSIISKEYQNAANGGRTYTLNQPLIDAANANIAVLQKQADGYQADAEQAALDVQQAAIDHGVWQQVVDEDSGPTSYTPPPQDAAPAAPVNPSPPAGPQRKASPDVPKRGGRQNVEHGVSLNRRTTGQKANATLGQKPGTGGNPTGMPHRLGNYMKTYPGAPQ